MPPVWVTNDVRGWRSWHLPVPADPAWVWSQTLTLCGRDIPDAEMLRLPAEAHGVRPGGRSLCPRCRAAQARRGPGRRCSRCGSEVEVGPDGLCWDCAGGAAACPGAGGVG